MDNPETQVTLGARHRIQTYKKNTIRKTKIRLRGTLKEPNKNRG